MAHTLTVEFTFLKKHFIPISREVLDLAGVNTPWQPGRNRVNLTTK